VLTTSSLFREAAYTWHGSSCQPSRVTW